VPVDIPIGNEAAVMILLVVVLEDELLRVPLWMGDYSSRPVSPVS
jgi:hypothetical protein